MLKQISPWLAVPAVIILLVAVYILLIRPRILTWGATSEEVARRLPGDEMIQKPMNGYTYAITIPAPAAKIWPWLVQMGYERAGFYSHDWVYKLVKADKFVDGNVSSSRIVPELQDLQVGDGLKIHSAAAFTVDTLQPNHTLLLRVNGDMDSMKDFDPVGPLPKNFMRITWLYQLEEIDAQTTRMIVRWRSDYTPSFGMWLGYGGFLEPGSFYMQSGMMQGIVERVKGQG